MDYLCLNNSNIVKQFNENDLCNKNELWVVIQVNANRAYYLNKKNNIVRTGVISG